jgi:hypothetical protein
MGPFFKRDGQRPWENKSLIDFFNFSDIESNDTTVDRKGQY